MTTIKKGKAVDFTRIKRKIGLYFISNTLLWYVNRSMSLPEVLKVTEDQMRNINRQRRIIKDTIESKYGIHKFVVSPMRPL